MSQHYSDPSREDDEHALPDIETFYMSALDFVDAGPDTWMDDRVVMDDNDPVDLAGWYYHFCFPGCLPDSDAVGPFATEAQALEDAREGNE